MEKKILEYEKFIARETGREMSAAERSNLWTYHREMIANFQHERLIHLIITLFFAAFTILSIIAVGWVAAVNAFSVEMIPFYVLAAILVVLSFFYVKHYYFLENHIQGLYKYSDILRK